MALILVICQKIEQMGLTLAMLTKSAFLGGANARHGFYQGRLEYNCSSNNCKCPPCKACRSAAVKFSPETARGSRHEKCCEIFGEILLFVFSSNKRCFLNSVFQSGVFRVWLGSTRAEGTKMLENAGVFRYAFSLWRGFPLSQAEVRKLKNTVWKTPFGTLRSWSFLRKRSSKMPKLFFHDKFRAIFH